MRRTGYQGNANPFISPMEKSIENAANITYYHWARLDAHKGDGTWQSDMFNDFDGPAQLFSNLISSHIDDFEAQKTLTSLFESEFMDMGLTLDKLDTLVRTIHDVDTDAYRLIWGSNRNRFYNGSYENRLNAIKGLATEMSSQAVPLAATAALAYHTAVETRHNTQQTRMDKVGVDSKSIEKTRSELIQKLNKNRGGLIFHFAEDDNCQELVDKYFPLNLLGNRSQRGHYQLIVPKGSFRKVAIHTFKPGEKVEVLADGADVWISMADNANNPIASGYKAINGASANIDPLLLGDLTKKYIIATNVNLTTSCDLIFNINKM